LRRLQEYLALRDKRAAPTLRGAVSGFDGAFHFLSTGLLGACKYFPVAGLMSSANRFREELTQRPSMKSL
jgi:hypothetical protein